MFDQMDFKLLYDLQFYDSKVSICQIGNSIILPGRYYPLTEKLDHILRSYKEDFLEGLEVLQKNESTVEVPSTLNFPSPSRVDWAYNAFMNLPKDYQDMIFLDLGTSHMPNVMFAAEESKNFSNVLGIEYFEDLANLANKRYKFNYPKYTSDKIIQADFLELDWSMFPLDSMLFYYYPQGLEEDLGKVLKTINPRQIMIYTAAQNNCEDEIDVVEEFMLKERYMPSFKIGFNQKLVKSSKQFNYKGDFIVVPDSKISQDSINIDFYLCLYELSD